MPKSMIEKDKKLLRHIVKWVTGEEPEREQRETKSDKDDKKTKKIKLLSGPSRSKYILMPPSYSSATLAPIKKLLSGPSRSKYILMPHSYSSATLAPINQLPDVKPLLGLKFEPGLLLK